MAAPRDVARQNPSEESTAADAVHEDDLGRGICAHVHVRNRMMLGRSYGDPGPASVAGLLDDAIASGIWQARVMARSPRPMEEGGPAGLGGRRALLARYSAGTDRRG